jgi:hypothetical protein
MPAHKSGLKNSVEYIKKYNQKPQQKIVPVDLNIWQKILPSGKNMNVHLNSRGELQPCLSRLPKRLINFSWELNILHKQGQQEQALIGKY